MALDNRGVTARPVSDDGAYEWDGTRWLPRNPPPTMPPPPTASWTSAPTQPAPATGGPAPTRRTWLPSAPPPTPASTWPSASAWPGTTGKAAVGTASAASVPTPRADPLEDAYSRLTTTSTGPAGGYTSAAPAPSGLDNSFAWTLAFTPLILLVAAALISTSASVGTNANGAAIGFGLALVVNTVLSVADSRRLRAAGVDVPVALALFLVPVYLFLRQARSKGNYAIPIVWCLCFAVSLGGSAIVANTVGVRIDTAKVDTDIAANILSQTGVNATVQCPTTISVRPGGTFQCVVTASDGSTSLATVTVQNSSGDILWRLG